ncbi:phage tail tape measure protein [Staphylococcus intermedius]|uniref:phage tail tape measure protein n=1 Tax=Staphylococcus intermedius TaxID=1285 RepID=UPI000BBBAC5C|nr:phage tail tape measure protein [Staphylococcus intermedius]PCF64576.1 phage tail tape measure protein [Staphylococcus intermedius]PCF81535.1 phage tail tape measure protein [Staphylococcus intermedius]
MAERIKGLQIDLSMQDMGIGATLAGIRRSFKQLNSDLKLSSNNFKYSEKSMASYKNRIRELDAATKQQRNNVKELRKQYEQMVKDKGANNAAAVRLRTEYNKQADTLNRLEHELEQTVGDFKRFQKEAQQAARVSNSSFGRLGQKFTDIGPKLKSVGESMKSVGRSMSMYVTAPAVAGFGLAVKASVDYEQAIAGVAKTTNMSGKELNNMSDKILGMSKKMPFAATEIAGVAESAGQLGVKKKDITSFTKTMLDMGVATNLTADEAATEFARFANAAKMPISDVGRLGSTVTALGNTTATTEKEIVEMGQRLAGAGAQAGFSADQIMSISAAMSSAGINAEAGGTAMTQIMNKMTKAAANGGEELESFAKTSGMSAEEFAQTWENNPSKALSAFVKGLSQTKGGAKGVIAALDQVGIKGVREADTIRRMANNHKLLDGALKTGADAWKKNTALTNEANTRYKTMGSQLQVFKNKLTALAIDIGNVIAPVVVSITKKLGEWAEKFTELPTPIKGVAIGLGIFAAALGPLILTTGMFTAALGSITTTLGPVMTGITEAGGVMNFLRKKAPFAAKGLTLVGGAFKFMLGPVGLAIAAVVAIGTAFVIAYKKSETFRNIVNKVINPVVSGFKGLWNVAKDVFNSLKNLFSGNSLPTIDLLSKIMPKATALKVTANLMQIRQAFKNIGNFFKGFFVELKNLIGPNLQELGTLVKTIFLNVIVPTIKVAMGIIWSVMKFLWPLIKALIVDTWNNIKGIVKGALDIILGIVKIFSGIFTGQWGKVWSGVKQVFSGALTFIWNLVKLWLIGKVLKVVKFFGTLLIGAISAAFNGVKTVIGTVLKFIWSVISVIFKRILSFSRSIFTALRNFIKAIWTSIKNIVVSIVKSLWSRVKGIWNALYSGTKSVFNKVKSWLSSIWNSIRNNITRIASNLWSRVKGTWQKLWSGTRYIFNKVKNWMTNIWNSIKNSVTGIASKLWNSVRRTFNNMKNGLKSIIDKIKGHINGMVNSVKKGLNKLIDGVNWVAGKIGMDELPKLKLHTGTTHTTTHNLVTKGKINQDTFATVGDKGRGNGPGGFRHEMIRYPNGKMALTPNRDTTAFLPKGSAVYNGAQTHSILKNAGQMPKFSTGTMFDLLSDKKKPHAHKHGDDMPGDVMAPKAGGGSAQALLGQVVNSGKAYVSKALGAVAKGKNWLSKTVGDVLDWIDKPGKLLDKILDGFGVNFDFLKGAEIPFKMMTAMFKKLRKATVDLFTGWLEDSDGGEGGWVDISKGVNFPFSPNGRAPGYPFPYPHMGVDLNYVYDKLYSTHSGIATGKTGYNGGFGNHMSIKSGIYEIIYGHMSKLAWTGSKRVHPGSYLGVSGNTGMSSGPHLHYEMRKNGVPINPMPFLKSQTKGKGGRSKSPSKWRSTIVRAAKRMGVNPSNRQINGIIAQIQRESGGDAGITQSTSVRDINALTGNLAQGLLQYVPSTFRNFAVKGHTNIKSGYDQLLAFFNNSNWANDIQYGRSGWGPRGHRRFASGGLIKNSGWYNLAEGGYPEYVISTDPALYSDSMKLLDLAAQDIDSGKTLGNKRPGQLPRIGNSSDNTALLMQMIENQQQQINQQQEQMKVLMQIAAKELIVDESSIERMHNKHQDKRERYENKLKRYRGGAFAT